MKNKQVFTTVLLAILGAWAIVLRMFDFPILPAAPFLKVDFSDLMVLIGLLIKGPIGAIAVALIRDLLNYMMKGGEAGIPIGAIMSFTASMTMFLPMHFVLKKVRHLSSFVRYLLMSVVLITGLVVSMSLLNYYVTLPLYITVMNFSIPDINAYMLSIIIPFNLIKGIFLAIGQIIIIEKVWPIIIHRQIDFSQYRSVVLTERSIS